MTDSSHFETMVLEPRQYTYEATLLALDDSNVAIFYDDNRELRTKTTSDGGRTWGEPVPLRTTGGEPLRGYRTHPTRLKSERLGFAHTAIPHVRDGLAGSTLPDPLSARVTEEKHERRYSCRLDKDYEAIHSAHVQITAPGRHTCSAWMKSTHPNTEVRMIVVSAERTGKGYGKAKFQRTEAFRIGTQWQRYWFEAPLVETSDGRYQIIVHLLVRRGGDSEPSTRRIDLRPRSNPEKVYYDQTSWQQMKEADGRPKPWMLAYSAMAYLLESSRPAGQVQLHDRVRCYLFTKPDTTIAVVWGLFTRTHGSGRLVFNPAVHTRVLDIMANPVECRLGPRLAIPVTSTSYYLLFTTADRSAVAAALRRGKVEWQRSD